MCEHGDTVTLDLLIPAHLSHTGEARRKPCQIDRCISELVTALNNAGITTIASCCGHGKRPGSIILHNEQELIISSGREMTKKLEEGFPSIHGFGWGDPVWYSPSSGVQYAGVFTDRVGSCEGTCKVYMCAAYWIAKRRPGPLATAIAEGSIRRRAENCTVDHRFSEWEDKAD